MIVTFTTAFEDWEETSRKLINVYEYGKQELLTELISAENKSAVYRYYDSDGKAYKIGKGVVYDTEQEIIGGLYCPVR